MEAKILYQSKEYLATFIRSIQNQPEYQANSDFKKTLGGTYTIMFEFFVPEIEDIVSVPIHHLDFITESTIEDEPIAKILTPIKISKRDIDE